MKLNKKFKQVLERVSHLTGNPHPHEFLNKMVVLELTLHNELLSESEYTLMDIVINKVSHFYEDDYLTQLWEEFVVSDDSDVEIKKSA